MTHIREYTTTELGLPAGSTILSATTPFDGDRLELVVRLPEEAPTPAPVEIWDMESGFEASGQGYLFSRTEEIA